MLTNIDFMIPDNAYKLMQTDLSKVPPENRLTFISEKMYEQQVYTALTKAERLSENADITESFPILSETAATKYIAGYTSGEHVYRYTGTANTELYFLELVSEQARKVSDYNNYLDNIQLQAEQMSS